MERMLIRIALKLAMIGAAVGLCIYASAMILLAPAMIYFHVFYEFIPTGYQVLIWGTLLGSYLYAVIVKTPSKTSTHGSAHWGKDQALRKTDSGLLLGRSFKKRIPKKDTDNLLRFPGEGHLVTIAKTRSGKGVGSVIPNLLTYPGSVVVTDIKGENYAVTAARRRELGHELAGLDPFGIVGGSARFNPLDLIDPDSPDAIDEANMLADTLVISQNGKEAFWDTEAHALLAGLILYVCTHYDSDQRTLGQVRHLLTLHPKEFEPLLERMLADGGLIRRAAARVLQKSDRERSGVISTAQAHTHFLDSPRMETITGESSFDLADLKGGRLSLFLILPSDRLDSYSRWLRLMISCSILSIIRTPSKPKDNVLFMLDEFANLGFMKPLIRAFSLLSGYGASLWIFLQDLAQLKATYKDHWYTFLANAAVLQTFGTADKFTAEYLSAMTGKATVKSETKGQSSGSSQSFSSLGLSSGRSVNLAETGRNLLLPDEIRRLPKDVQLLFIENYDPIRAKKIRYFADPEFEGMFAENPLHESVKVE